MKNTWLRKGIRLLVVTTTFFLVGFFPGNFPTLFTILKLICYPFAAGFGFFLCPDPDPGSSPDPGNDPDPSTNSGPGPDSGADLADLPLLPEAGAPAPS
ncbi:hypothetical protein [Borreliella yangtzensis]|uniref:hypothetical protein n=2 Tax=Borreliella yangtzensis TaxID=683292 RepID=UPI003B67D6A3